MTINPFEVIVAIATALATVASIAAIIISIVAYRQRIRFHPQPLLEAVWGKSVDPVSGFFFRDVQIVNNGDAAARDVRLNVDSGRATDGDWADEAGIEPKESLRTRVPLVDRITRRSDAGFVHFDREGDPADYAFVTPTITVTWRQAPFSGKRKSKSFTAPHTPDMKNGEIA